ncbi:MAG: glucokinase [SAR324 cluster bacterium]|nr:glucokinase [SAR324 cluster bacterium]
MKILAADIGGTNSRFAHFDVENFNDIRLNYFTTFNSNQKSINSVSDLIQHFDRIKSDEFSELSDYDMAVVAVAGPIRGKKCTPPNIRWEIDVTQVEEIEIHLLNDFVVQAYGCLLPHISSSMEQIKDGEKVLEGTIAIVGAGTGLGHCALIPYDGLGQYSKRYIPVPSEAGHAQLALVGDEEKELEQFVLKKTNSSSVFNELLVSGRGLSLIHEFLTGDTLEPKEVAERFNEAPKTLEFFSRLYSRACRNFCLSVYATGGLIISGGIAAKHPKIVQSHTFLEEFTTAPSQAGVLEQIPIFHNKQEDIGLLGCAYYGLMMSQ